MAPLLTAPTTRQIQWASGTQREAFVYGPYPQCMSGGWGSGKTWNGCMKGLTLSTRYKRNRGVIARQVGSELRATTMATFFKVCPPDLYDRYRGGRRNDQHGYVKLRRPYESEILFLHLDDPETEGVIRGLEINWFLIDQAEENPEQMEEIFDMLMGRLGRWDVAEVPELEVERFAREHPEKPDWPYLHPEKGTPVPPAYPMLACNPDVEVHWIYRRFHPESEEHQQMYAPQGYKMFEMPSEENRFLGEVNRKFLLAHDEAFIRRNVKGLWGMPEGAIHSIDKRLIIKGTPEILEWIRHTCLLFRTMDYGDSSPTCVVWWAVDRAGNVFAYREYYQPNMVISKHRENIFELSRGERYEMDLADPSIFHTMPTKQGGRWSIDSEYAEVLEQPRETAIFWKPADNNELGTRNRINEYLRIDDDRVHPFTHEPGAARVYFITPTDTYPQGCYHVLRETRSQRRVKVGTNLGKPVFSDERDPTVPDHAYDPFRYFIASRPPAPPPIVRATEGTFLGAKARLEALARRRMGIR